MFNRIITVRIPPWSQTMSMKVPIMRWVMVNWFSNRVTVKVVHMVSECEVNTRFLANIFSGTKCLHLR